MCKVFNSGNGSIDIETPKIRNKPYKPTCRKKNKNEYIDLETGEIIEVKQHSKNRADKSIISRLYKTLKHLQRLLLLNFKGANNEKIITLTYYTDFKDLKTCYADVKKFISKLKTRLKVEFDYVIVAMFPSKEKVCYELWVKAPTINDLVIDNTMLKEIWTNGKVFASKITDIIEQSNYIRDNVLVYFPAYCKLYRKSKGIADVKYENMTYAEAMVMIKDMNMKNTFRSTKLVTKTTDNGLEYAVNSVTYESFVSRKFIKDKGGKTMADYIAANEEKKKQILEQIHNSSNYKDVAEYIKSEYVLKDLQWLVTKVNAMYNSNVNFQSIMYILNTCISNTIANVSLRNNFNLYQTSSYNGIRMLKDLLEYQQKLFLQIRWCDNDRELIEQLFHKAITTVKKTDIYQEIYNSTNNGNQENERGC